jgi:DHA2 family multidrug resistance protein
MITASIMLATIMQGVDNTIANVALPHIQGSLSAAQDQVAWVLTSYIVAVAIMTPLTGWLAGRLGIKYVFLMSVAGFTLASALCGSATSLSQLVIYRLIQGACGAGLVPLSQSVLLQINPPERHGQAVAIWGTGVMLGPIFGPMLGGWLTEDYNWRWIFYINLPVGVIASLGILIFIRETRHTHREAFDFFGFVTLSIAVGALQMLLDRGQLKDWFSSTEIWGEAIVSGVCFYLFIVHTATAGERSFINRDLLKSPNFMAGTVLMFFIGGILSGTLALLPTMLQSLMNYPVMTTGLVTAPRGIGTMIAMFVVGRMINRVDNRLIILTGFLLTIASLWQMTGFSLQMGMGPVILSGLLQGFGLGCTFVPLNTMALSNLPRHILTQGTAMRSLMRNLGGSIGISVLEALLIQNTQIVHSRLVEHLRPDNPLAQAPL